MKYRKDIISDILIVLACILFWVGIYYLLDWPGVLLVLGGILLIIGINLAKDSQDDSDQ